MQLIALLLLLVASASAFAPVSRMAARSSLNMVFVAPPPKDVKTGKNLIDSIKGSDAHKTLAAAIGAAKLESVFSGSDRFAIFAPTDAAFAKLPAGTVDALLKDIPKLTNILKYHVSANLQRPSRNGRQYDTLLNNEDGTPKETAVLVTVDTCDSFIRSANERAKVTATLEATNGFLFVIDGVLLPYEGKEPPFGPGSEKNDEGLKNFNSNPGESGQKRYGGAF